MSLSSITLKWGANVYTVDCPVPISGSSLKTLFAGLTNVPADRQKLMCRVWKGVLKDDVDVTLEAGAIVTLMGSAETVAKPVEPVRFAEDAPVGSAAAGGGALPAGLINEGNTCYANATLQCIRAMPGLRDAIVEGGVAAGAGAGGGGVRAVHFVRLYAISSCASTRRLLHFNQVVSLQLCVQIFPNSVRCHPDRREVLFSTTPRSFFQ